MTILRQITRRATAGVTITAADRRAANHAIADTLACIVAGQSDGATLAVRDAVPACTGPATLAGGGSAPAPQAALINGTAAHALDFDDNFMPGMSHASAVLVPALLAIGQERNASGADLITAYLTGLEAQALVGLGVAPEHYVAGWHGTSTIGTIGTAAGSAQLLGLDEAGITQAMSLAVSMASGMKGQFGTPAKPFHAGMAARNAVEAAYFARAGLTGREDILEHTQGFSALMAGDEPAHWSIPTPEVPHIIATEGLLPKLHPCCGSTHQSIDMVQALRRQHGFLADEVAEIVLTVGRANYRNLAYPTPETAMEARFSMQYCIALALTQDTLSLSDFTPSAVKRPHLRALFDRIHMQIMPLAEEKSSHHPPHKAQIRLHDGRVFNTSLVRARGNRTNPFDEATRKAKLHDCFAHAGRMLTETDLAPLADIPSLQGLDPLARLLQPSP